MQSTCVNTQENFREVGYAICIENLCVSYGDTEVVRNLCMSVKPRTM